MSILELTIYSNKTIRTVDSFLKISLAYVIYIWHCLKFAKSPYQLLILTPHFFTIPWWFMNCELLIYFSKVSCYYAFLTIVNSIIFIAVNEPVKRLLFEDNLFIIVDI